MVGEPCLLLGCLSSVFFTSFLNPKRCEEGPPSPITGTLKSENKLMQYQVVVLGCELAPTPVSATHWLKKVGRRKPVLAFL